MPEHVSRQPAVYTARPAAIAALAASPWSPLVAIGGQRQIVLYNTDSSELAGVLPFPEGIPYSLRFSRSGKLLLAGGGHSGGQGPCRRLRRPTAASGWRKWATSWTPSSPPTSTPARRSSRWAVRKSWCGSSTSPTAPSAVEIRKHTDWITALEFSPDGVLLATADRAGGVFVWEAGTDREFQALEGHKAAVTAMSWRDDSNVLATAGEDGIDHASGASRKASGSRTFRPIPAALRPSSSSTTGGSFPAAATTASSSGTPPATRSASTSRWANW